MHLSFYIGTTIPGQKLSIVWQIKRLSEDCILSSFVENKKYSGIGFHATTKVPANGREIGAEVVYIQFWKKNLITFKLAIQIMPAT